MTGALQCPHCALRFARKTELDWHLREDHPHPKVAENVESIPTYRPPEYPTYAGDHPEHH